MEWGVGCGDSVLGSGRWREEEEADAEEEGQGDTTEIEELVDAVDPLRARAPFERDGEGRVADVTFEGPADLSDTITISLRTSVLT